MSGHMLKTPLWNSKTQYKKSRTTLATALNNYVKGLDKQEPNKKNKYNWALFIFVVFISTSVYFLPLCLCLTSKCLVHLESNSLKFKKQ